MSRLGKMPIIIPSGVEVKLEQGVVHVKGPKGSLRGHLPQGFAVRVEGEKLFVTMDAQRGLKGAFHGLHRALLKNMVTGVSQGFEVKLAMVGVGYRAFVEGSSLALQVGCSHPIKLPIPSGVTISVDKNGVMSITGLDRQVVGQVAAQIRAIKPPEPYKGKGIRYEHEHVRKKAGKAAKAKTAAG